MKLPLVIFKTVASNAPLIAIDLIVRDENGQILLGRRNNPPAKDYFFVPGGRIFKNEPLISGLERIVHEELDVKSAGLKFTLLGIYEHIYEDGHFLDNSTNAHYIVIAVCVDIPRKSLKTKSDDQHAEYQLLSVSQIMDSSVVHPYTKNYFLDSPNNKFIVNSK